MWNAGVWELDKEVGVGVGWAVYSMEAVFAPEPLTCFPFPICIRKLQAMFQIYGSRRGPALLISISPVCAPSQLGWAPLGGTVSLGSRLVVYETGRLGPLGVRAAGICGVYTDWWRDRQRTRLGRDSVRIRTAKFTACSWCQASTHTPCEYLSWITTYQSYT